MSAIDITEAEADLRTWADVFDPRRELDPDLRTLLAGRVRAHWISAQASAANARRWRRQRTRDLDRAERVAATSP